MSIDRFTTLRLRRTNHNASSSSTLMSLPDELLVEIVGYAVTTGRKVTVTPRTMRQDVMQIKEELLAPFEKTAKLLAIAEKAFRAEDLTYSFNIHNISVNHPERAVPDHVNGDATMCRIGAPACPELFLRSPYGSMWLGTGATWIKHLDIVIPSPLQATSIFRSGAPQIVFDTFGQRKPMDVFAHLPRTFPYLVTLRLRLITYRVGPHDSDFVDETTGNTWWASQRPDLVAMALAQRVAIHINTLDRFHLGGLKSKTFMLFQKREIDWSASRDQCIEEPMMDFGRETFGAADVDTLVWHLMEFPSCRLRY